MSFRIIEGDCIEAMRGMDEASVDAVVCDPPYGLEFMGKEWDRLGATNEVAADSPGWRAGHGGSGAASKTNGVPFGGGGQRVRYGASAASMQEWHEAWATEALRVLKPGGHLIAAGSSRTFHRLVCAVEDAGFEIRDTITWHFGSGFPKSLNVSEALRRLPACSCDVANEVGAVGAVPPPSTVGAGVRAEARTVPLAGGTADHAGGVRPNVSTDSPDALSNVDGGVEQAGGNDSPVMLGASGVAGAAECDQIGGGVGGVEVGPEALRDQVVGDEPVGGTAVGAGSVAGDYLGGDGGPSASPVLPLAATPSGVSGAGEPLPIGGSHAVAGAVDGDSLSVADGFGAADGAGELHKLKCKACGGVRREAIPEGFGTALKPATEFWTLARKPLTSTVAGNVLAHGTGALNVDGCRVGTENTRRGRTPDDFGIINDDGWKSTPGVNGSASGRWPANVILDPEAAALLDEQSGERQAGARPAKANVNGPLYEGGWKAVERDERVELDSGGASRFFYCAKASRAERNAGLEGFRRCSCETFTQWVNEGQSPSTRADSATPLARATTAPSSAGDSDSSTIGSGSSTTGRSPKASTSTTSTATSRTTGSKTSDSSTRSRTSEPTPPTTGTGTVNGSGAAQSAASGSEPTPSITTSTETDGSNTGAAAPATSELSSKPSSSVSSEQPSSCPDCGGVVGVDVKNVHPLEPTVKPIALMRWLCRLVTPPGGTILDPFTGSGTTGCAAVLEDFDFIGIERELEYVAIAEARIAHWASQPKQLDLLETA